MQIKNDTETAWNIEYEIRDPRGVFRNKIFVKNKKTKEEKSLVFEGKLISFLLEPDEIADLFWIRNTCYDNYKKQLRFDESKPSEAFVNVKNISVTSELGEYNLNAAYLEPVLDKNSNTKARISVKKIVKYFNQMIP